MHQINLNDPFSGNLNLIDQHRHTAFAQVIGGREFIFHCSLGDVRVRIFQSDQDKAGHVLDAGVAAGSPSLLDPPMKGFIKTGEDVFAAVLFDEHTLDRVIIPVEVDDHSSDMPLKGLMRLETARGIAVKADFVTGGVTLLKGTVTPSNSPAAKFFLSRFTNRAAA